MKKTIVFISVLTAKLNYLFAQASTEVEMADAFRSSGKIYVVIGVLLIILFGIAFYLFYLDRKIKVLEKKLQSKLNSK